MQRSFLWPKCLPRANTILGFPQAVCMIPDGADNKDFKGILGLGEKWKTHLCPSLCVSISQGICQPGLLVTPGVCRRVWFQRTQRTLTLKDPKKEGEALICNWKTASNCFAESILLQEIRFRRPGNNFQWKGAGTRPALSARRQGDRADTQIHSKTTWKMRHRWSHQREFTDGKIMTIISPCGSPSDQHNPQFVRGLC